MKLLRFRQATCKIKKKESVQKVASQCILDCLAKTFRTRNLQNLQNLQNLPFSAFRNGISNLYMILTITDVLPHPAEILSLGFSVFFSR